MSIRSDDASMIQLWLERQASPLTRDCYHRDAGRLLAHVGKPLARVALADLQSFAHSLVEAGLAPVSRARVLAAIKSLFGFCQRMRYLPANPAAELVLPSYEARLAERIVGEDDVNRMLAAEATPRDGLLLRLLYAAGLRVSEACGLRWRNLRPHGDAGQITVFGKGGRTRSIALPEEIWADLYRFREGASAEVPVFASRSGMPLDRGRVRIIVRTAARRAGLEANPSPHWLRHAHASHALDHGAPIHLVQATLGHSSVATTSAYLHARPGDSSARFLNAGTFLQKSARPALPFERSRVIDVMHAEHAAKGEYEMKCFTIDETNNITAHASRKEAKETGLQVFATDEQLAEAIGNDNKRLLEIWNSLPGVTPVKKFANRKLAAERIWKAIQGLGASEAPSEKAADPETPFDAVEPTAATGGDQPAEAAEQVADAGAQAPDVAPGKAKATRKATAAKNAPKGKKAAKGKDASGPREGSKTAQVVAMLQRKNGATLEEIMVKFGWQRHTVRGFMAGAMKKAGYTVESFKPEGGERTYRITDGVR